MTDFVIPKKIISYLIRVQKEYENAECDLEKNLIESARVFVREAVDYDNWGGDTYTHDIVMYVPLQVAAMIPLENQETICENICKKLSHCSKSVRNESIGSIYIATNANDDLEFQQSVPIFYHEHTNYSGDDDTIFHSITQQDQNRIWGNFPLRVFLSHQNEEKVRAKEIKDALSRYGVACFVAHEDIEVTRKWQDEIERALMTMHVLVPLLTDNFNVSEWTDQEVGAAVGRGVFVVPLHIDKDPYGFIGKYQAVKVKDLNSKQIARILFKIVFENEKTKELAKAAFIAAVANAGGYDVANTLATFLPKINTLSEAQIGRLCKIYHDNSQVNEAYGFKGCGGLAHHLKRITGDEYVVDSDNNIKIAEAEETAAESLDDEIAF